MFLCKVIWLRCFFVCVFLRVGVLVFAFVNLGWFALNVPVFVLWLSVCVVVSFVCALICGCLLFACFFIWAGLL